MLAISRNNIAGFFVEVAVTSVVNPVEGYALRILGACTSTILIAVGCAMMDISSPVAIVVEFVAWNEKTTYSQDLIKHLFGEVATHLIMHLFGEVAIHHLTIHLFGEVATHHLTIHLFGEVATHHLTIPEDSTSGGGVIVVA